MWRWRSGMAARQVAVHGVVIAASVRSDIACVPYGACVPAPVLPTSLRQATAPVFHYASGAGLLGMVDHHGLWASEAGGLNDLAEVRQGWDFIRTWLGDQPSNPGVDLLRDLAEDPLNAPHEVFVLCASTDGDDANQWRLYADGGKGYAVELDPAIPLTVVSTNPPSPKPTTSIGMALRDVASTSHWLHVLYDDDSKRAALQEILDEANRELAAAAVRPYDEEEAALTGETMRADLYEALATVAHLMKAPGFRGENEVRVVATSLWKKGNVRFRDGAYGVVGYMVLAVSPSGHRSPRVVASTSILTHLPIRSVRLGPLVRPENVATIEGLLHDRGYASVEVETSRVPLR